MKEIKCDICDKNFKSHDALNMHNNSKHKSAKNKSGKNLLYIGLVVLLIIGVISFFVLKNSNDTTISGNIQNGDLNNAQNIPSGGSDSIQKITLSYTNNYAPNTIYAKHGIPVEITLDKTVSGCYRVFSIPLLKVSKISSGPSDTIKFTPDKAGIFRFQCGMNMGYGTLIVS